ncbi:hypothetical protein M406DRAFT_34218 [Cryphonectria parasitica EP155]|uniref:Fe2OG dioxygenase domain-containing protein n=1 Tax=Cryphonectria parasitica (strain ATCC 38755 / EP155) TaxID=660469 RepID=A0A9P4YE43_CRYP1|nr:uncharacterized protein M406DRAFT_34218 [Cryphonectria parasitica EP155]KAF3771266.1 hypothetical protein M406DRAFT_34218 [Cryphonectria parasitica EP155]
MSPAAKIPVIDVSSASHDEQAKVAKELVEAAIEHGFVYIRNRGADIPVDAVENAFHLGNKIFSAPVEEKEKCTIQKDNRGWSGMNYETLDPKNQRVGDFKEAFNFGQFVNGKAQQPLPESFVPYESQVEVFYDYCYNLSLKINHLLGIGLGVSPPTFFRDRHLRERGSSGNTLRFLYYPPLSSLASSAAADLSSATAEDVRAGAHSDYGSITLLFRLRGQAGLEVDTGNGTWAPVPVTPPGTEDDPAPPILVNIGDLLSYWTNGLLRSTVHRVVFPSPGSSGNNVVSGETGDSPRYSIAFFCHPVGSTTLEPVPSERVRNHKPENGFERGGNPDAERKAITADQHLQMRLQASYLQLYEKDGKK